jgi:hypothetical protein
MPWAAAWHGAYREAKRQARGISHAKAGRIPEEDEPVVRPEMKHAFIERDTGAKARVNLGHLRHG